MLYIIHNCHLLCLSTVVSNRYFPISIVKEYIHLSVYSVSVGVVFAFISNEKVNNSIRNMDGTVNTAVDNSVGFVEDTQRVSCTCFSSMIHFLFKSGGEHYRRSI